MINQRMYKRLLEKSRGRRAKRIWLRQQKAFEYMPLRASLGLCTIEELDEWGVSHGSQVKEAILGAHKRAYKSLTDIEYNSNLLCPKRYVTSPKILSGEYVVVEGSPHNAVPVTPRIEFTVELIGRLNLRNPGDWDGVTEKAYLFGHVPKNIRMVAEDELGYKGATIQLLRSELLKSHPKAGLDTSFYVHGVGNDY